MSLKKIDARLVGVISKPHGIRGETEVRLITDYPNSFKKGDVLFLNENGSKKVIIENVKVKKTKKKDIVVFKFEGIDKREEVECLRSSFLFRDAKDAPRLGEDEFWVDEIIGLKVYSKDGLYIGEVVDVIKNISNDNLVIKKDKFIDIKGVSGDLFFIPNIDTYIEKIDPENKKITLKLIPEYI
ncbi:MAG: 16S rRNA processing protein RimM [Actinobacteria bacterium]|nr:16S rRNA processing protein RimM [Actinomycetota bacterium]